MMTACDFIYGGFRLSDFGFMICKFDGSSLDTISAGSELTFNMVSSDGGRVRHIVSAKYEKYFETTFQICKIPNGSQDDMVISANDVGMILTLFSSKQFMPFTLVDDDWDGVHVDATFTVSRIESEGKLYGFELNMITSRPYAVGEPITTKVTFSKGGASDVKTIALSTFEIGHTNPSLVKITCNASGNLQITNAVENRTTFIANCKSGEVITMNSQTQTISTSVSTHKIKNDFNYTFFRLAQTLTSGGVNQVTASIPCSIEVTYEPVVKVVF